MSALEFLVSVEACNQCVVHYSHARPAARPHLFKDPQLFLFGADFLLEILSSSDNQVTFAVCSTQIEDHVDHGWAYGSLLCAGLEVGCGDHGWLLLLTVGD